MTDRNERECMFYQTLEDQAARCLLCPHCCRLEVGESGLCRGRENRGGKLIAVNYAQSIGISLDPIEKKPLYHFRPGSRIVSLGANSCNLSCFFCQNHDSSQQQCPTQLILPEELRELVVRESGEEAPQVAFTYTEPLTWYEYIHDFARLAPEVDIVLVSNGFINPEPLEQLLGKIKAMNIDLKSIRPEFYQKHCEANLEAVKQTIIRAYERGTHLELTNLIIPGLNDSPEDIRDLADFVAALDRNIPLHFSAYHPAYKSRIPATPEKTVLGACQIASQKLNYVYAGNIWSAEYHATKCPHCGRELISARRQAVGLDAGRCAGCSELIRGVF